MGSLLSTGEAFWQPGQRLGSALQPMEQAASRLFAAADRTLDIDGDLQMPSRIALPKAALSLPDLLSPQMTEMPSLPVAAASAGLGAKLEAKAVIDDSLAILAAKIKRILDEEARRHGIDV